MKKAAVAAVLAALTVAGGVHAMEGAAMPSKPLPGQAPPPCRPNGIIREVEIHGGCWVKLKDPADGKCSPKAGFVHEGHCYAPVDANTRPPPG